jgi:uncharacterized DUF497 family protein
LKQISWSEDKNKELREKRGVGFDDVLSALQDDRFLAIEEHPNKQKYPHQKILVVRLYGYIHIVPYVEDGNGIFLKTIYPDRKYHNRYGGGKNG